MLNWISRRGVWRRYAAEDEKEKKEESSSHFSKLKKKSERWSGKRVKKSFSSSRGWITIPWLRYQVFSGLAKASTMHCNRTWLSTGAPTNWFTALTDGGTGEEKKQNKFSIN